MNFDLMCAIASGQPDPLVLPFLAKEIECKHFILFVSEWSREKNIDENIRAALQPRGIKVTSVALEEDNWEGIQQVIKQTLSAYPDMSIAFNGNGGTKPMTLAAYEYCYNEDIPMFYVDGNQLDWLYNAGDDCLSSIEIETSLSIDGYLLSHGYKVISQDEPLNSRDYKLMVVDWVERDQQNGIGTLNYIARRGDENRLTIPLEGTEATSENAVCALLDDLDRVGLIEFVTDKKIRFVSEEARFFANGGWYELYIFNLLQSINRNHFDGKGKVFSNLRVQSTAKTKKDINNEIDVAYLLNNRLYLFECKTANLSRSEGRADEAVYKLGTLLQSLGGLHAKGMIMSYRQINQLDKERASLLGITIVDHIHNRDSMMNRLLNCIK